MTSSSERAAAAEVSSLAGAPDFFIVGHAKCGTSALYETLRRHPQIFMPAFKEPWFFGRDNPQPGDGPRSPDATGNRAMPAAEYLSLFADAQPGQLTGEGSTSYLWSHTAPAAIAAARPDARIIAILREPASFLRSLHLQLLTNHTESEKDFRKAVALDESRRAGRDIPRYAFWPQSLIYSDRVRYVEQLRRYDAVFPSEQILVIVYEDYRRDNDATLKRVLRFLDVDETVPVEIEDVNTTTRRVRSSRMNDLARIVNQGRGPASGALNSTIKAIASPKVRRTVLRPIYRRVLYGKPRPPEESFTIELRRRFKGEVVALSDYLGRDLVKLWGYDDLE